jgi:hypothetical protein
MWVFLSARFRRWMLITILLPVARSGVQRVAGHLERRNGPTGVSRALRRVANPFGGPPSQVSTDS